MDGDQRRFMLQRTRGRGNASRTSHGAPSPLNASMGGDDALASTHHQGATSNESIVPFVPQAVQHWVNNTPLNRMTVVPGQSPAQRIDDQASALSFTNSYQSQAPYPPYGLPPSTEASILGAVYGNPTTYRGSHTPVPPNVANYNSYARNPMSAGAPTATGGIYYQNPAYAANVVPHQQAFTQGDILMRGSHQQIPHSRNSGYPNAYESFQGSVRYPQLESQQRQQAQLPAPESRLPRMQEWSTNVPGHQQYYTSSDPKTRARVDTKDYRVEKSSSATQLATSRSLPGRRIDAHFGPRVDDLVAQMVARREQVNMVAPGAKKNHDTANADSAALGTTGKASPVPKASNRKPVPRRTLNKKQVPSTGAPKSSTSAPAVRRGQTPGPAGNDSNNHGMTRPLRTAAQSPPKPVYPSQNIVSDYENYHMSVVLYKVNEQVAGRKYAYDWLEKVWKTLTINTELEWHAHITEGFISNGDSTNFIVLYNATNRFLTHHQHTTSIGCYYDSKDDLIWRTVSLDLRELLAHCIIRGDIQLCQSWTKDMVPTLKRYHKAYWKATNMFAQGGLMNRALDADAGMELPLMPWSNAIRFSSAGEIIGSTYQEIECGEEILNAVDVRSLDISNDGITISDDDAYGLWELILKVSDNVDMDVGFDVSFSIGSSQWGRA